MQPHIQTVTAQDLNPHERFKIAAYIMLRLPFKLSQEERPIIRQTTDYLTGSHSAAAQRFLSDDAAELTMVEQICVIGVIDVITQFVKERDTRYAPDVIDVDRRDALVKRIAELNPDTLVSNVA